VDTRLTQEQELIRETAEQLARQLAPSSPHDLPARDAGDEAWRRLAEVGFLGMRIPEEAGGSPVSGVEIALVAEQFGRFCVPHPFIGSAVCAGEMLRCAVASNDVLGGVADGALRLAPVLDQSMRRIARRGEDGIAVETRGALAGLAVDPDSGGLVAVELGAVTEGQDLTREFRTVSADAGIVDVGDLGRAVPPDAAARALALALAALSADLAGVMRAALDLAVDYTGQREQFGVKVGTFQALQHMGAECLVSTEASWGVSFYAAWAVDALPTPAALAAAHTAKAYASEHAREVCETGIQMHGGIGMTWEAMPHVFLRRALVDRLLLGDENLHYTWLANARLEGTEERR
jgi:alkylation response protein AidB-like acyl-CoA dehydrogenase